MVWTNNNPDLCYNDIVASKSEYKNEHILLVKLQLQLNNIWNDSETEIWCYENDAVAHCRNNKELSNDYDGMEPAPMCAQ